MKSLFFKCGHCDVRHYVCDAGRSANSEMVWFRMERNHLLLSPSPSRPPWATDVRTFVFRRGIGNKLYTVFLGKKAHAEYMADQATPAGHAHFLYPGACSCYGDYFNLDTSLMQCIMPDLRLSDATVHDFGLSDGTLSGGHEAGCAHEEGGTPLDGWVICRKCGENLRRFGYGL